MNPILVIRGGAIGDFILTLPAIKLLRDRFPQAHLEILGYQHIIALAEKRFYADAICSIEYGALAGFFARESALPPELITYFGGFDLVVSYLFDPGRIFETNLKRCGIKRFLAGPAKLTGSEHAARQLARPLEQLGLRLEDQSAKIYPSDADRDFARNFLGDAAQPVIAFHPGSGSETKNWPIENWRELGEHFLSQDRDILVVSGEADEERMRVLESEWGKRRARFAKHLPLPRLAALLENSIFLGHDSGISHIAAAVGARCVLLFGPTDPAIWAPVGEKVMVLRAPQQRMRLLAVEMVVAAIER
ncbi:MAG TPA: glycosyltransferase family 9 protein [Chthoniobacterales bacterium]|nr:glycosyltransferase family 9 protein [Chthoniobacterales bacterium]